MWEKVISRSAGGQLDGGSQHDEISRMKVYGGWIVRTVVTTGGNKSISVAMVFVPDPEHKWEIEH